MMNLITNHGPLDTRYLNNINNTINKAISEHSRTIAIRIDLRMPIDQFYNESGLSDDSPAFITKTDSNAISRFTRSLESKIEADLNKKRKAGRRVFQNTLRYIWVKEYGYENKPHYHVLLLLNKDNYTHLGNYSALVGNLACKIQAAWMSALNLDCDSFRSLVHFPDNPIYLLDIRKAGFQTIYADLVYRVSYFAKLKTKVYGTGTRSFGCSQR